MDNDRDHVELGVVCYLVQADNYNDMKAFRFFSGQLIVWLVSFVILVVIDEQVSKLTIEKLAGYLPYSNGAIFRISLFTTLVFPYVILLWSLNFYGKTMRFAVILNAVAYAGLIVTLSIAAWNEAGLSEVHGFSIQFFATLHTFVFYFLFGSILFWISFKTLD